MCTPLCVVHMCVSHLCLLVPLWQHVQLANIFFNSRDFLPIKQVRSFPKGIRQEDRGRRWPAARFNSLSALEGEEKQARGSDGLV